MYKSIVISTTLCLGNNNNDNFYVVEQYFFFNYTLDGNTPCMYIVYATNSIIIIYYNIINHTQYTL